MEASVCPGCGNRRPIAGILRRQVMVRRFGREFVPAETRPARHPLCTTCHEWLWRIVAGVSAGHRPVLGAPDPAGRLRVFDDQCALCRELLSSSATAIVAAGPSAGRETQPLLICDGCDVWLAGLADDGRSVRGEAQRTIDGAYGSWPYPNLRDLVVGLDVIEAATDEVLAAACSEMSIRAADRTVIANPAVVLVESSPTRRAAAVIRELPQGPHRFVLVPAGGVDDLLECIAVGIDGWLTVPLTPQQIAAALGRLLRNPGLRPRWDPETRLPILDPSQLDRGVLKVTPSRDLTPAHAAWLVRRVSRGYDDVGIARGEIVVVPRAPERLLERIAGRLQRALADRCTVTVQGAGATAGYRRFDVAG